MDAAEQYDIFLSYRRDGGTKDAMLIKDALEQRGYRVFLDMYSLNAGEFDRQLYRRIDECRDFVLILPQHALDRCESERDWLRLEIEHAHEKGKNIIPILLDGFSFPESLPASIDFVRYLHGLHVSLEFFDASIDKLTQFLMSEPHKLRCLRFVKIVIAVVLLALVVVGFSALKERLVSSKSTFVPGVDNVLMEDRVWAEKHPLSEIEEAEIEFADVFDTTLKRREVQTITFLNTLADAPERTWDLSANGDKSVLGWVRATDNGLYDLYIAGEGGVSAPEDCTELFCGYINCTSIDFGGAFHTRATSFRAMFAYCYSLSYLDVSKFNTANATDMSGMFLKCKRLQALDVSKFNTAKVTDMRSMFEHCCSLQSLDVGGFDTTNVTDMSFMLWLCSGLTSLDVSGFDTTNVTDMSFMFYCCSGLTSLDVSGFETYNVTDMSSMFHGCFRLTALDVSGFSTSNVTDMSEMFFGCSRLTILNVSGFHTDKVTDMSGMFFDCYSLTSLAVRNFNTANVTNMSEMFFGCYNLFYLDVSEFDTSKATDMSEMFFGCLSLTSLDVSGFKVSNVKYYDDFMPDSLNPNWRQMFENR